MGPAMTFVRFAFALLAALCSAAAWAGPPYLADDPQPTDLGKWEIYGFASGAGANGALDGATGVDLNYGALPGLQLTATLPVAVGIAGRDVRAGRGDIEIGVKYRFFHSEAAGIDVAIFPRIFLPTGGQRFGTGRVRLLLPVWAQKDFGPWSLFGGGGLTLNPGAGNRDFWETGLALTRTVTPRLSLGAEIAHQGPDAVGAAPTTALNFGGIYRLHAPFSLLFSGGPNFARGAGTGYQFYLALGLAF